MSWRGALGGALATGLLGCLAAPAAAGPGAPDAALVLRRADLVRNPYLGVALDLELSVASRESGRVLRRGRYTLLTHRSGRTLMLLAGDGPAPEAGTAPEAGPAPPGALLVADDTYWLLLPRAERPVELALRHVVAGDLSHAGFLRTDLRTRYVARHDGEESVDGVECWRLELEPSAHPAPFGRVRYWVAKEGFLPIRIAFHDAAGALLKTARFTRYQDTGLGRRPARIEIEDAHRPVERATLTLGSPRGVPTSALEFDLEDLQALRDAGRLLAAGGEGPVRGERLVAALAAAARQRALRRRIRSWEVPPPPVR